MGELSLWLWANFDQAGFLSPPCRHHTGASQAASTAAAVQAPTGHLGACGPCAWTESAPATTARCPRLALHEIDIAAPASLAPQLKVFLAQGVKRVCQGVPSDLLEAE